MDHPTGLVRAVPYWLHLWEDRALGVVFITAPSAFHFTGRRLPIRVRGQCDQRTHFDRPHRMDWMPDLSDTDALQGPPGVSRPAAEASAPSREAEFEVDLFVIGDGSGGVHAARVASGHGAKVMLAEEYRLGGTCVIRGCVPKKLFVYASRFSDTFDEAAEFGWRLSVPHFDWPSLVAAKDREITRLEGLYGTSQESAGVEVVVGIEVPTFSGNFDLTSSAHRSLLAAGLSCQSAVCVQLAWPLYRICQLGCCVVSSPSGVLPPTFIIMAAPSVFAFQKP